jgi:tricorn protease
LATVCRNALVLLATIVLSCHAIAALPRYPNLHNGTIVFVADGNLWEVSRTGGTARRLTSDPGQDVMPRYSPDGKWIAFTASYQGNVDVYVIPAAGGPARRVTFQSDIEGIDQGNGGRMGPNNMVVTWTPDSKNIVFLSRREAWNNWMARLFAVPVEGGLPVALPLDSGGLLTYSPDGHSIAYNRIFRNFRTWKRYEGGLAQQVFTYNFDTQQLAQITDWKGTNTAPMWYRRQIYFLSDRDKNWRANIWAFDLDTKQTRQITQFSDYDIDFPSLGDDAITFQQGGKLYVLDLPSEDLHALDVTVPDDGTRLQPRTVSGKTLKPFVRKTDMGFFPFNDEGFDVDYALAPNGKRALFSARGDILSVPLKNGPIRNLTNTPGADEDHPAWSPDGTMVAYTTDVTGEQQIAVRPAIGGEEKIITHFPSGYFYTPVFSPDGKMLAVTDNEHRLWLTSADGDSPPRQVAQDPYLEIHDQSFSPDGRYLAFSIRRDPLRRGISIYEVGSLGPPVAVSDRLNDDHNPRFSPDGRYLYFLSARHENPVFSDTEFNFATLKSTGIYVAPLMRGCPSPFAPRSDEGRADAKTDTETKCGDPKPNHVTIDFDGLMSRAVSIPKLQAENIATLDLRDTRIFYQTMPIQLVSGLVLSGEQSSLHVFDTGTREDKVVATELGSYSLSLSMNEKTTVLLDTGDTFKIGEAAPAGAKEELSLDGAHVRVDPKLEWAELFDNAWRLERDFFYNTAMNGVDFNAVHESYRKLLPLVGSREDLNYLIGQMIGELSNSHTYVGDGDDGNPSNPVATPALGTDFVVDAASGRYRFATIFQGDNTRDDYRSPLTEPGVNVKEGDYVLAINGAELRAPQTPYELMVGINPSEMVTVTVAETPDGERREIRVTPIKSDLSLREKAWIDHNRETVDRLSSGRIAYIYLSDMEPLGLQQFIRQYYGQLDRQALIIDDRWNFGGFSEQMILERLRRIQNRLDVNRERAPDSGHNQFIAGPKIVLINHYSLSEGDIFPYLFREYGLGKLLGTRTWGGVRGVRGYWRMMDNGYIKIPEWSLYNSKNEWVLENHGVDPDTEVDNLPGELAVGHDKQLETAVALILGELGTKPSGLPAPPPLLPAYPANGEVPGPAH